MYAFMSDFIGICMRKLNWTDQTFAKPTLKDFIYELKCYEHLLVHNNDTTQKFYLMLSFTRLSLPKISSTIN